jgi:ankyrin repeat protein
MLNKGDFTINHMCKNKESFLHICILTKKFKSAKWLIENGIDISLKNSKNQQPIDLAIGKDSYVTLRILLETKK